MQLATFLGIWVLGGLAAPARAESDPVAAGLYHSCRITLQSGVECWGNNLSAQLGDGTTTQRPIPVPVTNLSGGVQAIVAGDFHTCALSTTDAVQCWGLNSSGQLGDGTMTQRPIPVPVIGLGGGVQAIAAGNYHTCALSTTGGVLCWGLGDSGQLGDGTATRRLTPVMVTNLSSGVQAIAAGNAHTCALDALDGVLCWGRNFKGELGDNTTTQRVIPVPVTSLSSGVQAIAADNYHTCAVSTLGAAQCWGANTFGELGDGTFTDRLIPVAVTNLESEVQAIAPGDFHTCAITTVGAVQCWGNNGNGRLGDGTFASRPTPAPVIGLGSEVRAIVAGNAHNCALTSADAVQCWGSNTNGQLGDGTTTQRATPVPVTGSSRGVVTPGITLQGPATADQDDFAGTSVAMSEDAANETLIVGAPGTAAGGEVYLYLRASGSLTSTPSSEKAVIAEAFAKNAAPAVVLVPPGGGLAGDKWGQAVATKLDGLSIAVGAPLRGGNGMVVVFRKPAAGWGSPPDVPPVEIAAPPPAGDVTAQAFGSTLAYAADGTLIVGAPTANIGTATAAGAAFAYTDNGTTVQQIGGALKAGVPQAGAKFGAAVAADNDLIAIGAPDEPVGAAYLFAKVGSSVGTGTRIQPAGGALGDKFGAGVAVDNGVVVIGAPGDDTTAGSNSGSARVFKPTGGVYSETSILMPATGNDQGAGTAVAVRGGNVLLGAPTATAFGKPQAGRAYLYQMQDQQFGADETADAILGGGPGDKFGGAVVMGRKRLGIGVPSAKQTDSSGVVQPDIGRTDTFILDGILRSGFE